MSSKAKKTSHNLQHNRSRIFFRNPALLKIVAWLGCLGFIGNAGIVWADLQPISAAKAEVPRIAAASASAPHKTIESLEPELVGPPIPAAWRQSASPATAADRLPNREVPIAISPAAASGPTAKIVRPQHADLLVADNYTVGVNGSIESPTPAEEFIAIPVPAPRQSTIPSQSREIVNSHQSQIQPSYGRQQSASVSQSIPTTSIVPKPESGQSSTPDRTAPKPSLATGLYSNPGRTGLSIPTPVAIDPYSTKDSQRPFSVKTVVVAPMRPAVTARTTTPVEPRMGVELSSQPESSVTIPVPPPRTQIIKVQAVAQLPQVTTMRPIPTVAPIPTVRPAAANFQSKPVAYIDNGEHDSNSELIYPLSSPAPTTSGFGWRTHPITGSRRFHSGIDIGAPMGAPVVAAGSGMIVTAGRLGGYGNAIVIQHNGVQQTLYGHLSEIFVLPGQKIEQGTVIGRVGSTGNSTGPHLHFESRMSTADGWVAVDPSDDVKYALDNLRRAMPFAQRNLPPGVN